jgi:DNA-binding response OmpR family regulator
MGGHILIVEDDANDQALVKRAFKKAGLEDSALIVAGVSEAKVALTGEGLSPPRAVLLDLKLQGESGFDLLRWIRSCEGARRFVPVVLFTSSYEPKDIRLAYELGASAFIVKPADFETLQEVVGALAEHWLRFNCAPE